MPAAETILLAAPATVLVWPVAISAQAVRPDMPTNYFNSRRFGIHFAILYGPRARRALCQISAQAAFRQYQPAAHNVKKGSGADIRKTDCSELKNAVYTQNGWRQLPQ